MSFWFKSLRYLSTYLCCAEVSKSKKNLIFCDFSWEGGVTLPKNNYKPSRELWESTLLRITRSVKQSDKHTTCYFVIRMIVNEVLGQWHVITNPWSLKVRMFIIITFIGLYKWPESKPFYQFRAIYKDFILFLIIGRRRDYKTFKNDCSLRSLNA